MNSSSPDMPRIEEFRRLTFNASDLVRTLRIAGQVVGKLHLLQITHKGEQIRHWQCVM